MLAANNYAQELADCSVFYMLSADIVVKAQRPELAGSLKETGKFAFELSSTLTDSKLALARSEMATKAMMKEMDNDAINLPILLNRDAKPCKDSIDNAEARMDYWKKAELIILLFPTNGILTR